MGSEEEINDGDRMLCRGCAAKLPAATLEAALSSAGVGYLGKSPEDAAVVPMEENPKGQRYCKA